MCWESPSTFSLSLTLAFFVFGSQHALKASPVPAVLLFACGGPQDAVASCCHMGPGLFPFSYSEISAPVWSAHWPQGYEQPRLGAPEDRYTCTTSEVVWQLLRAPEEERRCGEAVAMLSPQVHTPRRESLKLETHLHNSLGLQRDR